MARMLKLTTCAAIAMLIASCAPAEDEAADTAMPDTGAAATAPGTPGATVGAPSPTDTPRAPGPGITGPVHVRLSEWRVVLSQATAPAGWIMLHAMNEGQQTHALEVERAGLEWRTADIPPGGIAVLNINAAPGTYNVYCPLTGAAGNHQQLGMRTTLRVTAR